MTIGYIGLGAMGRALAGRLVGNVDLIVWDLNAAAVEAFVVQGAGAAASLADMGARCDIVLLCLPKSANVEAALFGEHGLAEALAPGSVIVDQTSGVPSESKRFAVELAKRGIALIDAPVAGGVPSAAAGQITIMASGSAIAYARAQPVLSAISPKLYHCSEAVGDGQAIKAINNLINSAYRMATLEIFAIGRRLGLGAGAITEALNAGPGKSFISYRLLPAVVERRSSTDFALTLMVKDLNQAAELGVAAGVPMPISDAARGMINGALNLLGPDSRLDDIVPFMERLTGTELAGEADAPRSEALLDAMNLVTGAIAACNRAIMLENIGLAAGAGLNMPGFAAVIANGSAASAQADLLFAGLVGGTSQYADEPLAEAIKTITDVARIGAEAGVPMQMTNQVRAQLLDLAERFGTSAMTSDIVRQLRAAPALADEPKPVLTA